MTSPKNARRGKSGREYVWPPTPPYELEVPSVTTILRNGLPKESLIHWSARTVAEYAVDHRTSWADLPREDAVDLLKRAPMRQRNKKADIGTVVHAAIARLVDGGVDITDLAGVELGYYDAAVAFLEAYDAKPLRSEATVYSREYGYAGTLDLLSGFRGVNGVLLVDFKTSKAVYDDNALQLVAYANADFIGLDDGTEEALPAVVGGLVVRLAADGSYEPVPFDLKPELFDVFLAAKQVHDWQRGLAAEVRGDPWKAVA